MIHYNKGMPDTPSPDERTFCVLSDGTGETAEGMVRAALLQYGKVVEKTRIIRFKNIRREAQVSHVVDKIKKMGAVIVHTLVDSQLRQHLTAKAVEQGVLCFDLLGPLLGFMSHVLKQEATSAPGLLHQVDDRYFKRIEAIEYTVKHDDGKVIHDLDKADIVLVGISRTSKTPLSIYLSHKGYKVANVPVVVGVEMPRELFAVDQRKVIGLEIDAEALVDIRRHRISKMGKDLDGEYASHRHVLEELEYSKEVFRRNKMWPVFNVTGKALEETAVEIENVISRMEMARGSKHERA